MTGEPYVPDYGQIPARSRRRQLPPSSGSVRIPATGGERRMRLIKIGLGSVNPTVGAVRSNVDRLLAQAREMAAAGVTVGCFSEQVVGGYPPEDLVQWRAFLAAQRGELERFAEATVDFATVFVAGVAVGVGGQIFNCAAVIHGGEILGLVPKEKLPTYNVFYEARTFS